MNKLDPFEGDEEGSDGEANPPAPIPDTDNEPQQQQQQQLPQVCTHAWLINYSPPARHISS